MQSPTCCPPSTTSPLAPTRFPSSGASRALHRQAERPGPHRVAHALRSLGHYRGGGRPEVAITIHPGPIGMERASGSPSSRPRRPRRAPRARSRPTDPQRDALATVKALNEPASEPEDAALVDGGHGGLRVLASEASLDARGNSGIPGASRRQSSRRRNTPPLLSRLGSDLSSTWVQSSPPSWARRRSAGPPGDHVEHRLVLRGKRGIRVQHEAPLALRHGAEHALVVAHAAVPLLQELAAGGQGEVEAEAQPVPAWYEPAQRWLLPAAAASRAILQPRTDHRSSGHATPAPTAASVAADVANEPHRRTRRTRGPLPTRAPSARSSASAHPAGAAQGLSITCVSAGQGEADENSAKRTSRLRIHQLTARIATGRSQEAARTRRDLDVSMRPWEAYPRRSLGSKRRAPRSTREPLAR